MWEDFFIWSSGADRELLKKSPLTEYNRQTIIGALICLTSLSAFFTSIYVLYPIFNRADIAVLGGFLWASLVFNLDRFLVLTLDPQVDKKGEYKFRLAPLFLRIILAALIGTLLGVPVQLAIFKEEIDHQIQEQLENEKNNHLQSNLEQFNRSREEPTPLENQSSASQQIAKEKYPQSFLSRYLALRKLGEENTNVWRASLFVILFFIFVEIAPLLARILAGPSIYELLYHQRLHQETLSQERVAILPVFTKVTYDIEKRRFLQSMGFALFGCIYSLLRDDINFLILGVCTVFSIGLLFDLFLVRYRYTARIYGNAALELMELTKFLVSRRSSDDHYKGSPHSLYPEPNQIGETETIPVGAPIKV